MTGVKPSAQFIVALEVWCRRGVKHQIRNVSRTTKWTVEGYNEMTVDEQCTYVVGKPKVGIFRTRGGRRYVQSHCRKRPPRSTYPFICTDPTDMCGGTPAQVALHCPMVNEQLLIITYLAMGARDAIRDTVGFKAIIFIDMILGRIMSIPPQKIRDGVCVG